jgi:MFS family permease
MAYHPAVPADKESSPHNTQGETISGPAGGDDQAMPAEHLRSDPSSGHASRRSGGGQMTRAFRHRNYRLFFGGQLISFVGSFLTMTATSWLVYDLTHSERMLGVVGFAGQIPLFVLTPFAGVWVDRVRRRRNLIVFTQILAMLQSFALAALALAHVINVYEVIALAAFQGVINAFDMPARQAFLVEMVTDREDLANAIALNSTMVHGARVLGPASAGILIGYFGAGACFLLDGLSYIAVVMALLAMVVMPRQPKPPKSMFVEMIEGLRYVWNFAPIRVLLIVMAVISLTGMPALSVLMPVFAEHFGGPGSGGARVLGWLGSCSGVGAIVGALMLARRSSVAGLGQVIALATGVFALALIAFGMSNHLWLSLLIVPVAGWGMITNFAGANTILQTLTEDDMRGRVMSFFSMAFIGMTPFGNLLAGFLAAHLTARNGDPATGASRTLFVCAAVCLLAAGAFAALLPRLRELVRPIYVKKGILPEVAGGLQVTNRMAEAGES